MIKWNQGLYLPKVKQVHCGWAEHRAWQCSAEAAFSVWKSLPGMSVFERNLFWQAVSDRNISVKTQTQTDQNPGLTLSRPPVWEGLDVWENPETTPAFFSTEEVLGMFQLYLRKHLYLTQEKKRLLNTKPLRIHLQLTDCWEFSFTERNFMNKSLIQTQHLLISSKFFKRVSSWI